MQQGCEASARVAQLLSKDSKQICWESCGNFVGDIFALFESLDLREVWICSRNDLFQVEMMSKFTKRSVKIEPRRILFVLVNFFEDHWLPPIVLQNHVVLEGDVQCNLDTSWNELGFVSQEIFVSKPGRPTLSWKLALDSRRGSICHS